MSIEDFERIDARYGGGTNKLISRDDLAPYASGDASDFLGRLITLFGAHDGDGFVLRHKPTGLIITAYSAQSGPSYGGGLLCVGPLKPPPLSRPAFDPTAHEQRLELQERHRAASQRLGGILSIEQRKKHALERRELALAIAESSMPGYSAVVQELEGLVAAAALTDHERIDAASDAGVFRVGVRGGQTFRTALDAQQTFDHFFNVVMTGTDWRASFAAPALFSLDKLTLIANAERVKEAWLGLLGRVERLVAEPPARVIWTLLESQMGLVGMREATERLHAAEPPET